MRPFIRISNRLAVTLCLVLSVVFILCLQVGNPQVRAAEQGCSNGGDCSIVTQIIDKDKITGPDRLPTIDDRQGIRSLLNFGFGILGGIALVVVALQGLRYSMSSGDPGKTAQARNGMIYAGVGIVVALVGVSLTSFVLDTVVPTASGSSALVGGDSIFARVAGLIAMVTGVISVIMIIIGGYRYSLSGADPSKLNSARNTIIYALVGAVISGIAGPILVFILNRLTG